MKHKRVMFAAEVVVVMVFLGALFFFKTRSSGPRTTLTVPVEKQIETFGQLRGSAIYQSSNPESNLALLRVYRGSNGEYIIVYSYAKFGAMKLENKPTYGIQAMCVLEGNVASVWMPVFENLGPKEEEDLTFSFSVLGSAASSSGEHEGWNRTDQIVVAKHSIVPFTAENYFQEVVKKNRFDLVESFPKSYDRVLQYIYFGRAFTYMLPKTRIGAFDAEEAKRRLDQWWKSQKSEEEIWSAKMNLKRVYEQLEMGELASDHKTQLLTVLKPYL